MRDRYPTSSLEMDYEEIPVVLEDDMDEVIDLDMQTDNNSVNSEDSSSSLEEEPSEQAVCVFKGHARASVFCGCLSKNGELAVTGSEEDLAYLWDTTTGNIILKCTDHVDSVVFAEFNYNDTYLATGDMRGFIQLWQLSNNVCCWQYDINDLYWAKWHHSANILFATCKEGTIYTWYLPKRQCKIFQGYGIIVESGTVSPDGKSLMVGYADGTIRIINLKDSTVVATIPTSQGHTNIVTDIACDMNNKLLMSVSTDGKTLLSTAHNGKVICVLQDLQSEVSTKEDNAEDQQESQSKSNNENWAETVAFCKDPTLPFAATATIHGELFIWDVTKQVLRHRIELQSNRTMTKLRWKGNTSILFVAGIDGKIRCIDAKTGNCLETYKGHRKAILDLCISQNEKRLLTVGDDSTAIVFDISSIH